ncbi:serine protease [Pelagibius sp. Alg239-R121]|uniref:S1 family peptidase n=1 Tax=Pelagibius sp. Alg239-R121 TaxID=2993448 RepID=UPI0024A65D84|nr:serine protease [Pelagibius sp. Alg239-R121]
MTRSTYFVTKTDVNDLDLIEVAGGPAVEHYEALHLALTRLSGPDVADIFAEPIYRRGNGEAPAVISWYGHLPDDARPLNSLDEDERAPVETLLRRKLQDVAEALKDPQMGPLIGAALHIRDRSDIWVLGDRPLIVNWAMMPSEVGREPTARRTHFAETIGRYLPLDIAPPISAAEMTGPFGGGQLAEEPADDTQTDDTQDQTLAATTAVSAATASAAAPAAAAAAAQATEAESESPEVHTVAVVEQSRGGGTWWRWIPLAVLLLVTGVALLLLSFPGVLLYPPTAAISDAEIAEIARENNDALRTRRDQLKRALEGAVCRADGNIEFPDWPLPPLDGKARAGASGTGESDGQEESAAGSDSLVPPRPERVAVPSAGGDSTNLLSYIEDRTAMVLVSFANSAGSGTGFFIGPDLFVTNDHVVFGPASDQAKLGSPKSIYVKSAQLGRGFRAELVTSSGQTVKFGRDFALLRVSGADAPFFPLWGSTSSIKLQHVIAAGFPGAYFAIDQSRSKMYDPNAPDMPDMIMTQGTVNAQQSVGSNGTLAVVHSADISSGNSGGPLVDQCGRVVGVNTFGIRDKTTQRFLNFSLHTAELLDFLSKAGAGADQTTEACQPQISTLPPVPRDEAQSEDSEPAKEPNEEAPAAPAKE